MNMLYDLYATMIKTGSIDFVEQIWSEIDNHFTPAEQLQLSVIYNERFAPEMFIRDGHGDEEEEL